MNGDLLAEAESAGFDLLITTDKGIHYQQNWTGRSLALLVLSTNDWTRLRGHTDRILTAVNSLRPSAFIEVGIPKDERP